MVTMYLINVTDNKLVEESWNAACEGILTGQGID